MPRRWSKLARDLEALFAPGLDLKLRVSVVRMQSEHGGTPLPRYSVELDGKAVWSYPGQFPGQSPHFPYVTDVADISQLVRDFVNAPAGAELPQDRWGLCDVLRAADRRLGRRGLEALARTTASEAARTIVRRRLG